MASSLSYTCWTLTTCENSEQNNDPIRLTDALKDKHTDGQTDLMDGQPDRLPEEPPDGKIKRGLERVMDWQS